MYSTCTFLAVPCGRQTKKTAVGSPTAVQLPSPSLSTDRYEFQEVEARRLGLGAENIAWRMPKDFQAQLPEGCLCQIVMVGQQPHIGCHHQALAHLSETASTLC